MMINIKLLYIKNTWKTKTLKKVPITTAQIIRLFSTNNSNDFIEHELFIRLASKQYYATAKFWEKKTVLPRLTEKEATFLLGTDDVVQNRQTGLLIINLDENLFEGLSTSAGSYMIFFPSYYVPLFTSIENQDIVREMKTYLDKQMKKHQNEIKAAAQQLLTEKASWATKDVLEIMYIMQTKIQEFTLQVLKNKSADDLKREGQNDFLLRKKSVSGWIIFSAEEDFVTQPAVLIARQYNRENTLQIPKFYDLPLIGGLDQKLKNSFAFCYERFIGKNKRLRQQRMTVAEARIDTKNRSILGQIGRVSNQVLLLGKAYTKNLKK